MEKTFSTTTHASTTAVVNVLSDLGRYPEWLDVVTEATPAPGHDGDNSNPAWQVTLTAKVGIFARSKRLRMVRTVFTEDATPIEIRFERRETDGRQHASWVMTAVVTDLGQTTSATVTLSYGGSLWTGPLEPVLDAVASRAVNKLDALVETEDRNLPPDA